jgi:tRNA-2-methylthio-N6-dimethylallyladenosine synthase
MNNQNLYIYTIGCQMNLYDSEQIECLLNPLGYRRTHRLERADLIVVNTCSIRAKAEQKAFSFIGRLVDLKRQNPHLVVAMGGCVAQQEKEKIFKRMPHVDLVFGTHALSRLPQIISNFQKDRCRQIDTDQSLTVLDDEHVTGTITKKTISAFVTIMRGCDNYCTYCVVPYVRGREASRTPRKIVEEIEMLVSRGVREVTLLGQNVNSYGRKERMISFSRLLALINDIKGLKRIRFTTSHPKDLGPDLMAAFTSLDKLCRHIHLPVQSGSDRILSRMNRNYTQNQYIEKVNQLREICPDIAITSDIIVGFPEESDSDFQQTLDLIAKVRYQALFAFKYSDRPYVPAAKLSLKTSKEIKNQRLQTVLKLQARITKEKHNALIGTTQKVLVEGYSKRSDDCVENHLNDNGKENLSMLQWTGRTPKNLIVNFIASGNYRKEKMTITGRVVDVLIEKAMAHSISGRMLNGGPMEDGLKGDNWYAA